MKLHILFLGTQMAIGGAQKVLLDQARWFHVRGHAVTAAFFYDRDGCHPQWQAVNEFPVINLDSYRNGASALQNAFFLLKGLWRLWTLIRRERFDAVETFTHDSNLLGLPLTWLGRVPVRVATHHGTIERLPRWRQKLHTWLVNQKIATILVAVSEMTRQKAIDEGIHEDRIVVIPNGIVLIPGENVNRHEVRKELELGEKDLFLLSVGRLVYQKAHEVLVAALPTVYKEFPNAKVGIFGEGYLRPQLQAQIESLGLKDTVKLMGTTNSIEKILAAADLFILPSRWEGMPIALLEAMSTGLPIVATRVEGVEEVMQEGIHGKLVPAEDVDALAQGILALLRDSQARQRMGASARQRILDSYSVDHMCERYLALIQDLTGSASRKT